jgi:hypothetical protein
MVSGGMTGTRRMDRCAEREPRSPTVVESVDSSRSPISVERSCRSRELDAPPRTTLTIDESQIVPAAFSLHFVRACARDCSTGMVVMPVPPPSAIKLGSEGSGARLPISSSARSRGGSSRAPALRAARRRADAPALVDVHRFTHEWEKTASLGLRQGDPGAIDRYIAHARVSGGDTESMSDAAYTAWRADTRAGRATVLISDSNEEVAALNARARTELILEGHIDATREVALHDGNHAAVGDTVITRRNDRQLRTSRTWVRNGDRWTVTGVHQNGSVDVRRQGRGWGSTVRLPSGYVKHHVELGYAVTSHRAQGVTTDTAHVVVTAGMTRENLYVAMTRGREANTAFVAIDRPDVAHVGPRLGDDKDATARGVLCAVLHRVGAEQSAHETVAAQQEAWGTVAQLAAEYETIAAAAQHDRWTALVRSSGLSPGEAEDAVASNVFGALSAELRRAEAHHLDVESLLARVVAARGLEDAQDVAAVLCTRIATAIARHAGAGHSHRTPRLIVGLIPKAIGRMTAEMRQALDERSDLIEARAGAVLDEALLVGDIWTRELGAASHRMTTAWRQQACTVAAYRDRYAIFGASTLDTVPHSAVQRRDAARARGALAAAKRCGEERDAFATQRPGPRMGRSPVRIQI